MVAPRKIVIATLVAGLAQATLLTGCVVKENRNDILRLAWRCQADVDCAGGWECRDFAFDPDSQGYCVKPCEADSDCLFGDVCDNEGFCVEPCDLTAPVCRDPKYHCQRWNMTPEDHQGICQPASPCDSSLDCGATFDQCLSSVVVGAGAGDSLEVDQSVCMGSCAGSECGEGYTCLPDALNLTGLPSDFAPEVCVPRCGQGNACPNGFRCLLDALQEINPTGHYEENDTKFCVPGLSGVGLPCRSDLDCVTGRCVAQPGRTLPDGSPLLTCALPCDDQGRCQTSNEGCIASEYEGQSMGFCFQAFQPCPQGDECAPPQQCLDMHQIGAGKICLDPCEGWRDAVHCGGQLTCVSDASESHFGCFPGWPGYPCASDDQCHEDLQEGTTCIEPRADPSMTLCTKTCDSDADCTFGDLSSATGYFCLDGICRVIGQPCGVTGFPLECGAGMECANFFGDGEDAYRFCTISCDSPRADSAADPACPAHFTCANLLQTSSPPVEVRPFCVQGLPGMMPCSRDTECWDSFQDGSQSCASLTGQPITEVGTCSVPCMSDADCRSAWSSTDIPVFCLPGAPDSDAAPDRPGACFANPSFDVLLGPTPHYQGSFCGANYGSPDCAPGYKCVSPKSGDDLTNGTLPGEPYCALKCNNPGDCPQSPTPHDCVRETGSGLNPPSYCRPSQDPQGLPFWAPCLDHRQCAWGLCYKEHLTDPNDPNDPPGHCTRLCGEVSGISQLGCGDFQDAECSLTAPHVCKSKIPVESR